MPESLFQPNDLDIRNLTVEAPRLPQELHFDPERDIPAEGWQLILEKIKEIRASESRARLIDYCSMLKLLSPTRFDALQLNDRDWHELRTGPHLLSYQRMDATDMIHGLDTIWQLKLLFPTLPIPPVKSGVWRTYKTLDRTWYQRKHEHGYLRLLHPALAAELEDEIAETWEVGLDSLQRVNDDCREVIYTAAPLRLFQTDLDPALRFNAAIWQRVKNYIGAMTKETAERSSSAYSRLTYLKDLAGLRLLQAETLAVTDQGVTITYPDPRTNQANPELPEQRRY